MSLVITPALHKELEQSGNVSCVVDKTLRLVYCNPAWDRFALSNSGEAAVASRVVGINLLDVTPEPLKRFYDQLFEFARVTLQMRPHDYECSSRILYRLFRMEVRPMPSFAGFVLVHALRVRGRMVPTGRAARPLTTDTGTPRATSPFARIAEKPGG